MRLTAKKFISLFTVTAIALTGFGVVFAAESPVNIVSYQGRVLSANGVPVSTASASMKFRLYTLATGGTCLWSNSSTTCDGNVPASTVARTITLSSGLFSENLGDTTVGVDYAAILDSIFADNATVYLGVTIGSDSEMSPRKRMTAAPYALNAQTLDGIDSLSFLQKSIGTTKGDLVSFSTSSTPARLAAGDYGQVLTANSAASTGLEWTTLGTLATQSGTFSGTSSGTNSGDVTIGTANGLSLSGQALSLTVASASVTGALTSADWTIFNSKQPAGAYLTSELDPLALKITSNLSDLNNVTTARSNLGLGTLATQNGTFSGTSSGTNTGDNSANSTYADDYRAGNFVAGTNYLAPSGSAAALTSFPTFNQNTTGSAASLTTARTIGGVSFNGTANITVATATAGFTVSGGALDLGANDLTMTGSLGATGARLTKGWFTDLQVTNAIAGGVTGNAGTVTNATLSTALTVNTGTVTLTGNAANTSALTIGAGSVSVSGANTGDVTIGTANGLSLSGQALSLATATTSVTGALSSTDWTTFNAKQATGLSWLIAGNASTADATNFIGTTDNIPFNIRVNNEKAGRIDHLLFNTFLGYQSGNAITTGASNTAVGFEALLSNITTAGNTAVGRGALRANIVADNVAVGFNALRANTTGFSNVAVGTSALAANITTNSNTAVGYEVLKVSTASNNTAMGANAMVVTTSGYANTAMGAHVLRDNTTGYGNTTMGSNSLRSNTIGGNNTAFGESALFLNVSGSDNTAVGSGALYKNTTSNNTAFGALALYNNVSGDENTAVGKSVLYFSTGNNNTAVGYEALYSNTWTSNNTAVGRRALKANTGDSNTAVGSLALTASTGANNTAVGTNALTANTSANNSTAVGYNALLVSTGAGNTAIGKSALAANTTAIDNTAIGLNALSNTATTSNNVALGYDAGRFIADGTTALTTPSDSTFLGFGTRALAIGATNETVIGYLAIGNGSNSVTLGNDSVLNTLLKGKVGIGTTSPTSSLSVGSTSQFQVNSAGAIVAATGIASSGDITFSGGGTFGTGTGAISLNGNTTIASGSTFTTSGATVSINTASAGTTNIGDIANATTNIGATLSTVAIISDTLSLTDNNWSVTSAGVANFVSVGATTPGTGAFMGLTATALDASSVPMTITGFASSTVNALNLTSRNLSGTLINVAYPAATTLSGALIGANIDLFSNVTNVTQNVTGLTIKTPVTTALGDNKFIKGISLDSPGAITSVGAGGLRAWFGVSVTTPTISEGAADTLGAVAYSATVPVDGIDPAGGGVLIGFNMFSTGTLSNANARVTGINIDGLGTNILVSAGSYEGLNIGNMTDDGVNATTTAIKIGSGWDTGIELYGVPLASATFSLIQLGNAIVGGNNDADGGTYIGANPGVFTGDFLNFQINGASKFKITANGSTSVGGTLDVGGFASSTATALNLSVTNVSGNLIDVSYRAATTLTGAVIGANIDLLTFVTNTTQDVTGLNIRTPVTTALGNGKMIKGISLDTPGEIISSNDGGFRGWSGVSVTTPRITQTAGSTLGASAYYATVVTDVITTGGTLFGYNMISTGTLDVAGAVVNGINLSAIPGTNILVNQGTYNGLNIGAMTDNGGGATTIAINIGSGWDAGISLGANSIVGTTGRIIYTNFDVDATGLISVAANTGLDTKASGALNLGDGNATTINIGGVSIDRGNTINIATHNTSADTINIGNFHGSTLLTITGGDDWNIAATGITRFSPSAAPVLDILTITNASLPSTTSGVDGLMVIFGSSNTSGSAIHVTPSYAGGGNDGLTYNVFEIDAFSPTNAAGNGDSINGIKIGTLSQGGDGNRIFAHAIEIGGGWDSSISGVNGSSPGSLIIQGGVAPSGNVAGGAMTVRSGAGSGSGAGGDVSIASGSSPSGTAGSITITAGTGGGANGTISLFATGSGVRVTLGAATSVAVCSTLAANTAPTSGTAYVLSDCSGTITADYAEQYPVAAGITYGDIVVPGSKKVITTDGNHIVQLIKSSEIYQGPVSGIVSNNYGDFTSAGYNVPENENPMPVALVGRVPVNVTNEGGPINVGDYITTSSTPGKGMKATYAGRVIGMALSEFKGVSGQVMVQINNSWSLGDLIGTDGTSSMMTNNVIVAPVGKASAASPAMDSFGLALRGSAWDGNKAQTVAMMLTNQVVSGNDYRLSVRNTANAEVAYITDKGAMQIAGDMIVGGKLYPSDQGVVQTSKYIYYDGSVGLGGDFMRTNAKGWSTGSYDFAEMFPSAQSLEPGDVVVFAGSTIAVERSNSKNSKTIAGIISTQPGFLAGDNLPGSFPVALAGRVPTKVTAENGLIKVGDPLAVSSTEGFAMKAVKAGPIIGYALESFDGTGSNRITVFVNATYWGGEATSVTPGTENKASLFAQGVDQSFSSLNMTGNINMNGNHISHIASLSGMSEVWKIDSDGTISTTGLIKNVIAVDNKKVETIAVTSPEVTVTLTGSAHLVNGSVEIKFADVSADFSSIISDTAAMRVVATPNGPVSLYVSEKSKDGFTVKSFGGDATSVEFDWMVTATRKGFEPLIVDPPLTSQTTLAVSLEPLVSDVLASPTSSEQPLVDPVVPAASSDSASAEAPAP